MSKLKQTSYAILAVIVAVVVVDMAAPPEVIAQVRAALVRDVDHPARQAVTIRKNTDVSIFETVYTVPANKKLVVEHMNCTSLDDQLYAGIFEGSLAHANIVYSVPVINTSATVLIADADTRLYFEPGAALKLRIFVSAQTTCTISGHTVDAT